MVLKGKNSLGTALVSQLQEDSTTDRKPYLANADIEIREQKKREAVAALSLVQQKTDDDYLRAAAGNALGQLHVLEGEFNTAAVEFLKAAEAFAAIDSSKAAGSAYTNAALAFYREQRPADAVAAAHDGLSALLRQPNPPQNLLSTLRQILEECGSADPQRE
jgi:uncharacterized protein HemY